jgi:hypothetical protein
VVTAVTRRPESPCKALCTVMYRSFSAPFPNGAARAMTVKAKFRFRNFFGGMRFPKAMSGFFGEGRNYFASIRRCKAVFAQQIASPNPSTIRMSGTNQLRVVIGWKDIQASRPWKSLPSLMTGSFQSKMTRPKLESICFDGLSVQNTTHDELPYANEALPPPKKYLPKTAAQKGRRTPAVSSDPCNPKAWTLEVSALKPHKILFSSEEFSGMLQYSSTQICNRSISVL